MIMKKVILGSILSATILLAGSVQAQYIDVALEAKLVKVCEAIKSDNKLKVHKAIENSGINARTMSKGLVCNGYDAVTFAIVNDAQNAAKYIARKAGVSYETRLAKL